MAEKKTGDNRVRKLTKQGGASVGLTLPIDVVRELGWREKQKVVVTRVRGGLMIRDWRNK
jgi:antitoxin component of MazEF toxin-antitoxin module